MKGVGGTPEGYKIIRPQLYGQHNGQTRYTFTLRLKTGQKVSMTVGVHGKDNNPLYEVKEEQFDFDKSCLEKYNNNGKKEKDWTINAEVAKAYLDKEFTSVADDSDDYYDDSYYSDGDHTCDS